MKQQLTFGLLLAFIVLPAPVFGQDLSAKGQAVAGVHEVEMKKDHIYTIRVEGKDFTPRVAMMPGQLPFGGQDFAKPFLYQTYYMAAKDEKNTILVVPELFNLRDKGPFQYQIDVKGAALSAKPLLDVKGELDKNDPNFKADFVDRPRHKAFDLKVKAGQTYVIDMRRPEGSMLDAYLYLLDGNSKIVRSDDDGGGFPHARIVYTATGDGSFRIIATGLGQALGGFHLTVRTTESK